MPCKLSIILPTYNEAQNILLLIEKIYSVLQNESFEVIVVDDDSPDRTAQIVKNELKNFKNLKIIIRKENKGLVPSIKEGIKASSGLICLWMDADFSMSPNLIKTFVTTIDNGADLVLGSRYIKGGGMKGSDTTGKKISYFKILRNVHVSEDSIISLLVSKFGNIIIKSILTSSIHDYSSGFFAAKRGVFDRIAPEGNIVDYCISLPYKAFMKGLKVVEVPMILDTRKYGKSKTSDDLFSIIKIGLQCFSTAIYLKFSTKNERKNNHEIL